MDILWKTFLTVQYVKLSYGRRSDRRNPHKYGVVIALHSQAARQHGRVARRASIISWEDARTYRGVTQANGKSAVGKPAQRRPRRSFFQKTVPKMKDPSGGTTGRVKPYGRLGWMGARAEYSRWGGITAPT